MEEFIDYYEILEVHNRASIEVIDKAYKTLAMKYHPDKCSAAEKESSNLHMQQLNKAKAVLSDSGSREKYDREWQQHNNPTNSAPDSSYLPASQMAPAAGGISNDELLNMLNNGAINAPQGSTEEIWDDIGRSISDQYPGILMRNSLTRKHYINNKSKNVSWHIPDELLLQLQSDKLVFYNDDMVRTCSVCDTEYHPNHGKCPICNRSKLAKILAGKKQKDWLENPVDMRQFEVNRRKS